MVLQDNFDRADGPLGPDYLENLFLPQDCITLQVRNNQACGNTQSLAIWRHPIPNVELVRISWTFTANSTEAFESYGIGKC